MKYKIIEGLNPKLDNKLNDIISGVAQQFCSLSALIGPIVGGLMHDQLGYEKTMDVNMVLLLGLCLFYCIFNCGYSIMEKERQKKDLFKKMASMV